MSSFELLSDELLEAFRNELSDQLLYSINEAGDTEIDVDYFDFYNAVSSVFSSKIEGEDIELDSFLKHKFLKVEFKPDYTLRANDLFAAYELLKTKELNLTNFLEAHAILTRNLLPKSQQGLLRNSPMVVMNSEGRIEYSATAPGLVKSEIDKLFHDIEILLSLDLEELEVLYYSSQIHFWFVKIHPFYDGNGRAGRLLEKWFLVANFKEKGFALQTEKSYYQNLQTYYTNLRKTGFEYEDTNFSKSLDFMLMSANAIINTNNEGSSH